MLPIVWSRSLSRMALKACHSFETLHAFCFLHHRHIPKIDIAILIEVRDCTIIVRGYGTRPWPGDAGGDREIVIGPRSITRTRAFSI